MAQLVKKLLALIKSVSSLSPVNGLLPTVVSFGIVNGNILVPRSQAVVRAWKEVVGAKFQIVARKGESCSVSGYCQDSLLWAEIWTSDLRTRQWRTVLSWKAAGSVPYRMPLRWTIPQATLNVLYPKPLSMCCTLSYSQCAVPQATLNVLYPKPLSMCCTSSHSQCAVPQATLSVLYPKPLSMCCTPSHFSALFSWLCWQ